MSILKNARHENFVQALITGMSQRRAYLEAFPNSHKWKDSTVDEKASRLFAEDKVRARYNELQEESASKKVLDRTERMELLSSIALGMETRDSDRIKALDILNKMDTSYVTKIEAHTTNSHSVTGVFADISTDDIKRLIDDV